MRFGIGLVVKLIGEDGVGCIVSDRFWLHHIVVGMIGWDGRGCNDDLGAIGPEQPHFFVRHLVRHGEDATVTLERSRDRQSHAGVA